jgi:HlyD family secretion protein
MNKRRFILITCALLLVAVCGVTVLKFRKEKSAQADTTPVLSVAVDTARPARDTLHRAVEVFGSLSPKTVTEIKSELVGRVQRVQVKEWDSVRPGDVLLDIDPTDLTLTVERDEAGLKMARA